MHTGAKMYHEHAHVVDGEARGNICNRHDGDFEIVQNIDMRCVRRVCMTAAPQLFAAVMELEMKK